MDTLLEDLVRPDADAQMTVLTHEDIIEQDHDISDEVEDLRNSLREAVHDETVRPKMQCLMMDPSFSMVTMQGEDSGIEWETNPSRCTTPWASEAGNPTVEVNTPITMRPITPGSLPAGRIIFVMDEEQISRRKKTKEKVNGQKGKVDKQKEVFFEDSDEISKRPELVGVSLPNVKTEEEGDEEEATDPVEDKQQQLFCLVSEGSEILNIVVPPKLATVDEEESTVMVDNLSYMEESVPVIKSSGNTSDKVFDLYNEAPISTQALTGSSADGGGQMVASHPIGPNVMDPPGAPVARPPGRGATANVDYFEKFTLIDAQAPGSPAVIREGQEELQAEGETREIQDTEAEHLKDNNTPMTVAVDERCTEAITGDEITSELLDEVFYGGTDDNDIKGSLDREEQSKLSKRLPSKLSLKESGSALFGSQEDILTPIFLPEGPPKIIDPILLEEPKAMAFLYTDLYEEAIGSRKKDEDTESIISEKSFHSRHSDREARGYLEKFVLKDETPVLEMEPANKDQCQEERIRMLSQDSYNFGDYPSDPEKGEMPATEDEITDFFRSSANSSPCDVEAFPPLLEEENNTLSKTKTKAKNVSIEKMFQPGKTTYPINPPSASSYDFLSEESGWESVTENPLGLDRTEDNVPTELGREAFEIPKPVAPPRRKAALAPKMALNLTPLIPVEALEEQEEAGRKEQREEEKETASPAETADEGDGDGEETRQASSDVAVSQNALNTEATEASETEIVNGKDNNTATVDRNTKAALAKGNDIVTVNEERSETETAEKQTGPDIIHIKSNESAGEEAGNIVAESTTKEESKLPPVSVPEPAKESGQCIIL